jgi:hypothetical protein
VRNSCLESTYAVAQEDDDAVVEEEAGVEVAAAEPAAAFPTKLHHPLEVVEEQRRNLRLKLGPGMASRWTPRLEEAYAAPAASDEHAASHAVDAPFQDNDQHSASLDTDPDSS